MRGLCDAVILGVAGLSVPLLSGFGVGSTSMS